MTPMKIKIQNVIDFKKVDSLLEGFNRSTGFGSAILDLDGKVISQSGWSQICTDFHRSHPETSVRCTINQSRLAGNKDEGEKYHFIECLNGLIDVAAPIIIQGEHLGDLYCGQFFFKRPERKFFKGQAKMFGFNEEKYLEALDKVPIVSKEQVCSAMDFLLNMVQLLSDVGFQKMEQIELNKQFNESENRFTKAFRSSPIAISITDQKSGNLIEVNTAWCKIFGFSSKEAIGCSLVSLGIVDIETQAKIDKDLLEGDFFNSSELLFRNKRGDTLPMIFSAEKIELGGQTCLINSGIDVSERKKVEEKFKAVFESANVGKSITLLTGEINVNQSFCDMLGYSVGELSQKRWQDITPQEDIPDVEKILGSLLSGERDSARFEKRYVCKNGSYIWTDLSVILQRDESGEPRYFITTVIDITQRKQMEDTLRATNERLERVLETETVGVMFWDLIAGVMIDANQTFLDMMGYSREDVTQGKLTWQKLTPPEFYDVSLAEIEKLNLTGRVGPYEKEYLCKDGTRRWLVFAGSALEGNTCVEFCVDVSDRKASETAFRLERDFSNAVIDSLPGVFYCYDENLNFKRWNKNFEMVTGYSAEEIEHISPLTFFAGSEKDLLAEKIKEVFSKGYANVEAQFVAKDGTKTPYYFTGETAIIDDKAHLVGVGIDISDRKRSEKALRESQERFATLFERSAFVAVFSKLPDGMIANVNKSFEDIFGYSKQEAIGKTTLELGINPDAEGRERILAELQKQGSVRNIDLKLKIKTGELRLFSVSIDLVDIGDEKFILNTMMDITESKRIEET